MILERAYYGSSCYGYNCSSSNWSRWGRWILAGILIFVAFCALLFVLFLNRRRRSRGQGRLHPRIGMGARPQQANVQQPPQAQVPYGGGGGGGGMYNQPQDQSMGYQQYAPPSGPPPQYGAGSNADYYGQTPEVSQPQNAYQPPNIK